MKSILWIFLLLSPIMVIATTACDEIDGENMTDDSLDSRVTATGDVLFSETFNAQGGAFKCSKNTCTWTSPTIAISGKSKLEVSAQISALEVGNFESSDNIAISYKVDSGAFKTVFQRAGDFQPLTMNEPLSAVGTTLQIRITAKTSAANEVYVVDNLQVRGSGSSASSSVLPFTEPFDSLGGTFKCSKNTCTWTSPQIATGGAASLKLSAVAKCLEVGNFETSDYLTISYRFNSGAWNTLVQRTGDFQPTTIAATFANSGASLQIKIEAKTSASNEIYVVDKLTVEKATVTDDTDDGPAGWTCGNLYYGKNNGCDCGCGAPDPDCNGLGCTGPGCKATACNRYHAACPSGQKCFLVTEAFGGQWKDVEKDPNESHDNLFCWVAGPSNVLDWSGWGRAGNLTSTDSIFKYAQQYWPTDNDAGPYDSGDDAYDMLKWFFVGDQPDEDFPPGGGFQKSVVFPAYCGGTLGKDPYVGVCPTDMKDDPKAIMKLLDAGYAAAIQMKGDVGGSDGGHVITLWGYSVASNDPNKMTGVFLTDSDDDKSSTNPPDRIFYRQVTYDGIWHILKADGSPYKYIKYVYGLRQK